MGYVTEKQTESQKLSFEKKGGLLHCLKCFVIFAGNVLFAFQPETDVPNTPSEILFQVILPNLPQYMVRKYSLKVSATVVACSCIYGKNSKRLGHLI